MGTFQRILTAVTELLRETWSWLTRSPADWLGILTLVFTGLTLCVVLYQIRLMRRQTSLMDRQLTITEKQDQIMMAELARKSVVKIVPEMERAGHLVFYAENIGAKTAKDVYWHLLVPSDILSYRKLRLAAGGEAPSAACLEVDGTMCDQFKGYIDRPLYPTRRFQIGHAVLKSPPPEGEHDVSWKTITEDGAYPPDSNKVERVRLTIDSQE